MNEIRQPICVFLGHVDHGKSSVLEGIRGKTITEKEAGGITQTIKAYLVGKERLNEVSGELLKKVNIDLRIPGVLFIDSPGHASFTSLRKRGGNIADIAVLVIDVNEGLKPQTLECLEILKQYKTPFIIALNKIDVTGGWRKLEGSLLENIEKQSDTAKYALEEKLYKIIAKLNELGFSADRFDRIADYTKKIAVVPTSGKTLEGISELVMVLGGLAQKFLEDDLCIKDEGKGVILEVLDDKNLGKTAEVILYEGSIKCNDKIIVGSLEGVFESKVRGLFVDSKSEKEVCAANCIKLFAPGLEKTSPGMPLTIVKDNIEEEKEKLKEEIDYEKIEIDEEGIIAKADSLGSLEALVNLLREHDIKVRKVGIGEINKKDIIDGKDEDELNSVVVGFNLKKVEDTEIKIITSDVIYKIIDIYQEWKELKKNEIERKSLEELPSLFKFKIMRNFIFRQSNPAVVGVEVLFGNLKINEKIMKDTGEEVTNIQSIQLDGKNVKEAKKDDQVAVAFPKVVVGRQINEDEIYYTNITENQFRNFKEKKELLSNIEVKILKDISEIKRKINSNWGMG
jgi:translation initiation factor 5B